MLLTILQSIPLWVFPLLLGLIWLGWRAGFDRRVSVWLIYALPLLGLLSLSRAAGLGQASAGLTALALAYGVGAGWGYHAQGKWIRARDARRVFLRGEAVTMVTVLGVFLLNFGAGMAQGIAPDLAATPLFALGYGANAGLLGGSLLGHALRVARWPVRTLDLPKD